MLVDSHFSYKSSINRIDFFILLESLVNIRWVELYYCWVVLMELLEDKKRA